MGNLGHPRQASPGMPLSVSGLWNICLLHHRVLPCLHLLVFPVSLGATPPPALHGPSCAWAVVIGEAGLGSKSADVWNSS